MNGIDISKFFERIGDIKESYQKEQEETINIIKDTYKEDREKAKKSFEEDIDSKINLLGFVTIFTSMMLVLCSDMVDTYTGITIFVSVALSNIIADIICKRKKENFTYTARYGFYIISDNWTVYIDNGDVLISGKETEFNGDYILEIDGNHKFKITKKQYKLLNTLYDDVIVVDTLETTEIQ